MMKPKPSLSDRLRSTSYSEVIAFRSTVGIETEWDNSGNYSNPEGKRAELYRILVVGQPFSRAYSWRLVPVYEQLLRASSPQHSLRQSVNFFRVLRKSYYFLNSSDFGELIKIPRILSNFVYGLIFIACFVFWRKLLDFYPALIESQETFVMSENQNLERGKDS